jgi:hypothetical protein
MKGRGPQQQVRATPAWAICDLAWIAAWREPGELAIGYGHHRAELGTEDYVVVKSRIRVICDKE